MLKANLIVGARAFHGNPHDGHTLNQQLDQATILMQVSKVKPSTAFVDLGYRRVDAQNPDVHVLDRGKSKRIRDQDRKQLKRCQSIELIISNFKANHRMDRCHLKGETGDRLHAVMCAAGFNVRWLLSMIAKKGVPLLAEPLLAPVHGNGRVTELARRAGLFAHAGIHPTCPAPCLESDLNKPGATIDEHANQLPGSISRNSYL